MTTTPITTARRLLNERRNLGITQAQMAARIGVTRRVYQGAETGGHEPRGENAVAFARYFECAVTDLWPLDEHSAAA